MRAIDVSGAELVIALRPRPQRRALFCPDCGAPHVDVGEWASRPHRKHLCLACGRLFAVEPLAFGVAPSRLDRIVRCLTVYVRAWLTAHSRRSSAG